MNFTGPPTNDLKSECAEVKLSEADIKKADLKRVPVVISAHRRGILVYGALNVKAVPNIGGSCE